MIYCNPFSISNLQGSTSVRPVNASDSSIISAAGQPLIFDQYSLSTANPKGGDI